MIRGSRAILYYPLNDDAETIRCGDDIYDESAFVYDA